MGSWMRTYYCRVVFRRAGGPPEICNARLKKIPQGARPTGRILNSLDELYGPPERYDGVYCTRCRKVTEYELREPSEEQRAAS